MGRRRREEEEEFLRFFPFGLGQFSTLTVLWGRHASSILTSCWALFSSAPSIRLVVNESVIVYARKEGTAVPFLSPSGLCSYLRLTRGWSLNSFVVLLSYIWAAIFFCSDLAWRSLQWNLMVTVTLHVDDQLVPCNPSVIYYFDL